MSNKALKEINEAIKAAKDSEAAYQELKDRFRNAYNESRRREIVVGYAKTLVNPDLFTYDVLERFYLLRKK
jgi:hypothetical protein